MPLSSRRTAYGVGSALGGVVAGRISARLGRPRVLAAALVLQTVLLVVLGSARSLPVAIAVMAVYGGCGMLWNVNLPGLKAGASVLR
jgi:predicted MFS family arabinose efflux permease